jgi:hypothetical protein
MLDALLFAITVSALVLAILLVRRLMRRSARGHDGLPINFERYKGNEERKRNVQTG